MRPGYLFPFILGILLLTLVSTSLARNPYRRAFFDVYPEAEGSALDDVPSNPGHCGVCHFDFDGSGQRNPYGLAMEVALNSGNYGSNAEAIMSLDGDDSDNDGFANGIESADVSNFTNTPTFAGLKESNYLNASNVTHAELAEFLTPAGSSDITPPVVTVISPNGGEIITPTTVQTIEWTATDESGISSVSISLSDDGGQTYKLLAVNLPNSGSWDWMVHNLPGQQSLIKVLAYDNAFNPGEDLSNSAFTISSLIGGVVPTTLRDFELSGTQPHQVSPLENPEVNCVTCHGNYDTESEPWHAWRGSMMGQAMRDPLYLATLVIAEQDAPSVGDLCLRCHTPGGWAEGRSADTSGGQLNAKDRQAVQCDFCHRQVDPVYVAGTSPEQDESILAGLDEIPLTHANGQFVLDPDPIRRGPYADAEASHDFLESPFHRSSALCGTCHDVSNPVFISSGSPGVYEPQDLDTAHPDGDLRNMFPVERTYSEWTQSEYASTGVYAPQFAGNKPDGMVSTCQDCHMADIQGVGSSEPGSPTRDDLARHDLTGGNYFIPDILADFFPDEVEQVQLNDAKQRVLGMLGLAATLEVSSQVIDFQKVLTVKVTNETGHKLPSGYPEGRRMWINVRAFQGGANLVYESGAYDYPTATLDHDPDAKIYEVKPGISHRLGGTLGFDPGPNFHFALSDTVWSDNRIPPRGFTNAAFTAVQSPPVGYSYDDGQYWDETQYVMPDNATSVNVTLYYQSTSKEYIEFLRDENVTDDQGQALYDAWAGSGKAAPVIMATESLTMDVSDTPPVEIVPTALYRNYPNPFNPNTSLRFNLAREQQVELSVYDSRGRLVRQVFAGQLPAGEHAYRWHGQDGHGRALPAGVYLYRLETEEKEMTRKMTLLK